MSSGGARAVQPAARTASAPGLARETPSLTFTAPGAGASGETSRAPRTWGGGRHSGRPRGSHLPAAPLPRWKEAHTPTVGPQTLHRAGLWNPPSGGDKGAPEELPGAGARSPRGPSSEREAREVQLRRGANPPPPQLRDPRDPHRCGAAGLAGPRGPVLLGPCTRPVRPQLLSAPVAGGSWEDSPDGGLCLPRRGGAAGSPLRGGAGRELRPARSPGRGGPPPASGCGEPVALAAAAKAHAAAAGAAATTTTARPGARRGLMLSSAVSPPLWVPGAAENLHIRAPSPSVSRPAARGLRPRPLASRDGARGRRPEASPAGPAAPRPSSRPRQVLPESYRRRRLAPAHPRAAAGCEPTAARPTPATGRGGACGTGRAGSRPG